MVVLPSPSGVGVIALTTTYLAGGPVGQLGDGLGSIFITSSPCGSSK